MIAEAALEAEVLSGVHRASCYSIDRACVLNLDIHREIAKEVILGKILDLRNLDKVSRDYASGHEFIKQLLGLFSLIAVFSEFLSEFEPIARKVLN